MQLFKELRQMIGYVVLAKIKQFFTTERAVGTCELIKTIKKHIEKKSANDLAKNIYNVVVIKSNINIDG